MQATGFVEEMNWNGYRLSQKPIAIYDLNSLPRYYDFIALDTENSPIGTLRVNATKEHSTSIKGIYTYTFNYGESLSKSTVSNPSLFIDWKGDEYVGIKSKAGEVPQQMVSAHTGEKILQTDVRELKGEEIIELMSNNLFNSLLPKDNNSFGNIPEHLLADEEIKEEIEFSKTITIGMVRDSMNVALIQSEKEAKAFWEEMASIEPEVMVLTEDEINADSKFFGHLKRIFRRVFSKTDTSLITIDKYDRRKEEYRRGGWCGPWVCGYILFVNQGVDKYTFFEKSASTEGELGVLNFALRLFGRPMTPVEMSRSMPVASNGRIWINPSLHFRDMYAYDQIKYHKKPVIRLCGVNGGLHWTLAYGARQTGNWLWRNYYFLQIDNGAKVGVPGNKGDGRNYTSVDWWNPWLMVWD